VDSQQSYGTTFRLIMCFLRDSSVHSAFECLDEAQNFKDKVQIVGLDSDEIGHPPSKFQAVFEKAKELGFITVAHGGHDGPPFPYVSELLTHLKVQRIDHGVRCVEEAQLMEQIKAQNIPLTVCPISNVKIGPYKTMKEHPIKKMMDNGLLCSINSDDPAYLGAYITDNFIAVKDAFDLQKEDIIKLSRNAIESAFVSEERRKQLHAELEDYLAKCEL